MGNTSIVEFNHDRWDEIYRDEESQQAFLKQLREQFSCAKYTNCEIKGGKVIAFFNRYEKVNEIWCKFKAKLQHFGY